jgi:hypothetical protein
MVCISLIWPVFGWRAAYHGPEKWLLMAYGDMDGLTVADFYR